MSSELRGPSPLRDVHREQGELSGGNNSPGVVRVGETVRRPATRNTEFVEKLLAQLQASGLDIAPRFLGRDDEGREVLSFIEGETTSHPSERREEAYAAGGRMLRALHDATANTKLASGQECVIHGDPGPFNTIFRNGMPVALIDWDSARPGRRLPDWAYMAWTWCIQSKGSVPIEAQARHLREIRDGYGFDGSDELIDAIMNQQRYIARASQTLLRRPERFPGHHDHQRRAIDWAESDRRLVTEYRAVLSEALTD